MHRQNSFYGAGVRPGVNNETGAQICHSIVSNTGVKNMAKNVENAAANVTRGASAPSHPPLVEPVVADQPGYLANVYDSVYNYVSNTAVVQTISSAASMSVSDMVDSTSIAQGLYASMAEAARYTGEQVTQASNAMAFSPSAIVMCISFAMSTCAHMALVYQSRKSATNRKKIHAKIREIAQRSRCVIKASEQILTVVSGIVGQYQPPIHVYIFEGNSGIRNTLNAIKLKEIRNLHRNNSAKNSSATMDASFDNDYGLDFSKVTFCTEDDFGLVLQEVKTFRKKHQPNAEQRRAPVIFYFSAEGGNTCLVGDYVFDERLGFFHLEARASEQTISQGRNSLIILGNVRFHPHSTGMIRNVDFHGGYHICGRERNFFPATRNKLLNIDEMIKESGNLGNVLTFFDRNGSAVEVPDEVEIAPVLSMNISKAFSNPFLAHPGNEQQTFASYDSRRSDMQSATSRERQVTDPSQIVGRQATDPNAQTTEEVPGDDAVGESGSPAAQGTPLSSPTAQVAFQQATQTTAHVSIGPSTTVEVLACLINETDPGTGGSPVESKNTIVPEDHDGGREAELLQRMIGICDGVWTSRYCVVEGDIQGAVNVGHAQSAQAEISMHGGPVVIDGMQRQYPLHSPHRGAHKPAISTYALGNMRGTGLFQSLSRCYWYDTTYDRELNNGSGQNTMSRQSTIQGISAIASSDTGFDQLIAIGDDGEAAPIHFEDREDFTVVQLTMTCEGPDVLTLRARVRDPDDVHRCIVDLLHPRSAMASEVVEYLMSDSAYSWIPPISGARAISNMLSGEEDKRGSVLHSKSVGLARIEEQQYTRRGSSLWQFSNDLIRKSTTMIKGKGHENLPEEQLKMYQRKTKPFSRLFEEPPRMIQALEGLNGFDLARSMGGTPMSGAGSANLVRVNSKEVSALDFPQTSQTVDRQYYIEYTDQPPSARRTRYSTIVAEGGRVRRTMTRGTEIVRNVLKPSLIFGLGHLVHAIIDKLAETGNNLVFGLFNLFTFDDDDHRGRRSKTPGVVRTNVSRGNMLDVSAPMSRPLAVGNLGGAQNISPISPTAGASGAIGTGPRSGGAVALPSRPVKNMNTFPRQSVPRAEVKFAQSNSDPSLMIDSSNEGIDQAEKAAQSSEEK